jgi:hypothetical protein
LIVSAAKLLPVDIAASLSTPSYFVTVIQTSLEGTRKQLISHVYLCHQEYLYSKLLAATIPCHEETELLSAGDHSVFKDRLTTLDSIDVSRTSVTAFATTY